MIPISQAIRIVLQHTPKLASEEVALPQTANRILAEDIIADTDLPPFDRAQMDGYAVRAADVANIPAQLKIVGESAAGAGWHQQMNSGEAVRIMTGAPVPVGADAVQQVELTREPNGAGTVEILESVEVGRSIVKQAAEIKSGAIVLRAGEDLNAETIATLASFGYSQVKVGKRPRVAVMATGSELVDVNEKPGRDQIRDSNNYTIEAYAILAGATVQRLPLAGDDRDELKRQMAAAVGDCDVLVTSGGVSMGVYDFTKAAFRDLGAEIFFERVALRPGKPTVFGRVGKTLIFGLPGNPVSVMVTFYQFVRDALRILQGERDVAPLPTFRVPLSAPIKKAPGRTEFQRGILSPDGAGGWTVRTTGDQGSGILSSMSRANCFIILGTDTGNVAAGEPVDVQLLEGLV